jgi:hypothetical protein
MNQQIGLCIYSSSSINFSKFVLSKEWSLRGHLWYNYDTIACVNRNCDHYTQVVWNEWLLDVQRLGAELGTGLSPAAIILREIPQQDAHR